MMINLSCVCKLNAFVLHHAWCFVVNAFYGRGQVHGKGGSGTLKRAQMVPRLVYDVVRTLPYGDDTV